MKYWRTKYSWPRCWRRARGRPVTPPAIRCAKSNKKSALSRPILVILLFKQAADSFFGLFGTGDLDVVDFGLGHGVIIASRKDSITDKHHVLNFHVDIFFDLAQPVSFVYSFFGN